MAIEAPVLVVTNNGNAAASTATIYGPFIKIIKFKVASGFGYEPQPTDTGFNGTVLYESAPLTYRNVGNNTIDIVCRIDPNAGPFKFGEVGVFIDDGAGNEVLFAKAVWEELQTKYSSLGTNVPSSFTFHCLLKLEQSIAVFQISTLEPVAIMELDKWSDVVPPAQSAFPEVPLILVKELDSDERSSLLHVSDATKWTVGTNYVPFKQSTITAVTGTTVDVPKADFSNSDVTLINRKYVIEFEDGLFRSVTSMVDNGTTYRFNLNPDPLSTLPPISSAIQVHVTIKQENLQYLSKTEFGIAKAGLGIAVPSPGVIETYGLLQGVDGSGRILTSADDINGWPMFSDTTPSGIYAIPYQSMPTGMVPGVNWPGHLLVTNYSTPGGYYVAQQVYYPAGIGQNGDANGYNGLPPYWRSWAHTSATSGYWTPWYPFSVQGKRPIGGSSNVQHFTGIGDYQNLYYTGTNIGMVCANLTINASGLNATSSVGLYRNGILIGGIYINESGGGESGSWSAQAFYACGVYPGDVIEIKRQFSFAPMGEYDCWVYNFI